ncbi:MAG TPA: hypothetical protein VLA19_02690 [Herpetosiphonaceae bacterium]|nr:hypothetical protein [Herpetosiphonaceae bacterium]
MFETIIVAATVPPLGTSNVRAERDIESFHTRIVVTHRSAPGVASVHMAVIRRMTSCAPGSARIAAMSSWLSYGPNE